MKKPKQTAVASRLFRALPPICDVRRGALVWSVAMAVSCAVALWLVFRGADSNRTELSMIFFLGGLIAWPFGLYFARIMALGCGPLWRFSAALLALSLTTVGATAFVFSQQYRFYFSQWHAPFMTRTWIYQFIETSASGVYQFAVLGLRLYFPVGIIVLILTGLWLARRMR